MAFNKFIYLLLESFANWLTRLTWSLLPGDLLVSHWGGLRRGRPWPSAAPVPRRQQQSAAAPSALLANAPSLPAPHRLPWARLMTRHRRRQSERPQLRMQPRGGRSSCLLGSSRIDGCSHRTGQGASQATHGQWEEPPPAADPSTPALDPQRRPDMGSAVTGPWRPGTSQPPAHPHLVMMALTEGWGTERGWKQAL